MARSKWSNRGRQGHPKVVPFVSTSTSSRVKAHPKDTVLGVANVIAGAFDFFGALETGVDTVTAAKRAFKRGAARAKAIRDAERSVSQWISSDSVESNAGPDLEDLDELDDFFPNSPTPGPKGAA